MPESFIIGWEEWLSLPDLGLPAIKAKVDTGARTSALHAHNIEPFGPAGAPLVRFTVNPIAGKTEVEVNCSAPIVDRREVTSSNGERESRYVILTHASIGTRTWPIEITLTNRETMSYRMLLGRQAIQDDMFVDPAASFRQPKLSYKTYRHIPHRDRVRRSLRIALLASHPDGPGTMRLAAAAAQRGHVVETIPVDGVTLTFDSVLPGLMLGDAALGHFDIVIPRFDPVDQTMAVSILRQLEMMGSVSLNPSAAMARLADPIALRQALFGSGITTPGPARIPFSSEPPGNLLQPLGSELASSIDVLVIGGNAVATRITARNDGTSDGMAPKDMARARRLALKAARSLQLRLATIGFAARDGELHVVDIDGAPLLAHFSKATGVEFEPFILADAEGQVRSWVHHSGDVAESSIAIDSEGED